MYDSFKKKVYTLIHGETGYLAERKKISSRYIHGNGIEIGGLHSPLAVPSSANVRYVDRLSVSDLKKQYPELASQKLVEVDIIDDGETLATIPAESQDFCIANHFLEHCQNPILAFENIMRVVKRQGIAYIAVPDKRYSFDVARPVTDFQHLMDDYEKGPEGSRHGHFEEWVRVVNKVTDEEKIRKSVKHLMDMKYSIHYHVWTQSEAIEFVLQMQKRIVFEIMLVCRNENEVIFVVQKV